MNAAVEAQQSFPNPDHWAQTATELGQRFAERASEIDSENQFVQENYDELREARIFSLIVPSELGGGGASYGQVSAVIRKIGRYCGSTALSLSMHTHPVALNVFKHHKGDAKATSTLQKVAAKELIIAGTGANDWLTSSGEMIRVDGGYRVTARKHFVSGGPGAQVFVTSSVIDGENGKEVIHFSIPFNSEGITRHNNWNTLGMRGTGSNDISLDEVFVPEDAIVARRPVGEWHPMWNVIIPTALPLIMSAYMGLGDAALGHATEAAKKNPEKLAGALGELRNLHTSAELALEDMVRLNANHGFTPSVENASDILTRKTLVTESVKNTVELACEIVGGAGFFKGHPMERISRDIRASHFHPLPYRRQYEISGRIALGLDPVKA